ncbi:MAG: IS66 family transposase [Bacillus subtilis]|nr:IS66 family transposase [Bacillus subtilis]
MAKRPPPYDEFYGQPCPYRLACPHLQGQNVETIASQTHHLREENHHLRQREEQLVQQVHQLEARIAELQRRHRAQFKTGSTDDADAATGTDARPRCKRGAPKGHPAWTRPQPDRVDQIVPVPRPPACPHCHTPNLDAHPAPHTHRQEDIVLVPRTVVTEYQHAQSWCPQCGRPVHQTGPNEMRQAALGPVAKATAAWLRYDVGISYRKVQRLFAELFGLRFVPAAALGFDHQLARRAAGLYADLRAKIKVAETLHADETHWRVDGANHFLWYAGNAQLSCYHIDRHRSGPVAVDLVGQPFAGLLHADDYAAYNLVQPAHRQSCLAHHLRTAEDLQAQLENAPPKLRRRSRTRADFLQPLIRWIQRVCHARQQAAEAGQPATCLKPRCARWLQQLDQICRRPRPEPDVETFRQRLIKHRDRLLAFVEHPDGQPTNNAAEQALRPSVILRKITFGNRSAAGARNHSVITSLIQTAGKQSAAPRDVLEKLFCDQPNQAQAALYPNAPDTS